MDYGEGENWGFAVAALERREAWAQNGGGSSGRSSRPRRETAPAGLVEALFPEPEVRHVN